MKTEGKEHRAQMENFFERFRVEMPVEPEEVNLIGVDFGDGELSAVLARVQDGRISLDPLFPDSTRVGYKCPNVLFLPDAPISPVRLELAVSRMEEPIIISKNVLVPMRRAADTAQRMVQKIHILMRN